jgi:hypothetical protein
VSTKCGFRVPGKPKTRQIGYGPATVTQTERVCGKNVETFVRVEYSELSVPYVRDGKFYDVFGFCTLHGKKMLTPEAWGLYDCPLRGVRGVVKTALLLDPSEVPDPIVFAKLEGKLRLMASCKSDIKRHMGLNNTSSLTPDDWRQIFAEALDEYVVEGVMES